MRTVTTLGALAGLMVGLGPAASPPLAAQAVRAGAERATPIEAPGAGWLGVRSTMTVRFDPAAGTSTATDLMVDDVYDGGPAWEAGLRTGDRIVGLNGRPLRMERFQSLASRLIPGDPVSLTVVRDGRELEFALEAARRPGVEVLAPRRIQEALDSTRRVFVTRLDSVNVTLGPARTAPWVELRRIEADSIRTVEVRAEGGARTLAIRTSDGVFEWLVEPPAGDTLAPRPFSAWAFRSDGDAVVVRSSTVGDSIRVVARIRPDAGRAAAPTRSVEATTAPVRPLAPYLAGMNRVAGAEFTPLVGDLATYFQVDVGLLVTDVAEGTPAAAASLVPGDVIVSVRGRTVASIDQLRAALSLRDEPATLELVRRGRRVEVRLLR